MPASAARFVINSWHWHKIGVSFRWRGSQTDEEPQKEWMMCVVLAWQLWSGRLTTLSLTWRFVLLHRDTHVDHHDARNRSLDSRICFLKCILKMKCSHGALLTSDNIRALASAFEGNSILLTAGDIQLYLIKRHQDVPGLIDFYRIRFEES